MQYNAMQCNVTLFLLINARYACVAYETALILIVAVVCTRDPLVTRMYMTFFLVLNNVTYLFTNNFIIFANYVFLLSAVYACILNTKSSPAILTC